MLSMQLNVDEDKTQKCPKGVDQLDVLPNLWFKVTEWTSLDFELKGLESC